MGKKVDLRRIENPTKCHVTFSKHGTGLIKKVRETSVSYNTDVASGRVSKFSNQNRIEDVLGRYSNLPAGKRYPHITNVKEKLDKLKLIAHISGDENKLHFLNNQIKQMEQQIRKSSLASDLLETSLSDYEPDPACDPPLAQLLWCERALKDSLQRVTERKNMLLADLASSNEQLRIQKEQKEREIKALRAAMSKDWGTLHPYSTSLLMQLDPWLSPHSPKVRQTMLQELSSQQKRELFAGDNQVKLFNYANPSPIQNQGLAANWNSLLSQQLRVLDVSQNMGRFGQEVPLVAQPQQYPAQTMTYKKIYEIGHNGTTPMSYLHGNGTNYHVNSSIGNNNINLDNLSRNSLANNHVNSSIRGYYSTIHVDNGNRNSIASKHADSLINGNLNVNVSNWNQTTIANNHVNSSTAGDYNTEVDNGNRNSIANKHVNSSINRNHNGYYNTNVGNWNQNSIANYHLDSSASGNYKRSGNHNTNLGDGNQNLIAYNHVTRSTGRNYNNDVDNANQNSIANNNVNPSINDNNNASVGIWNQDSIANHLTSSTCGDFNTHNSIADSLLKSSFSGNQNTSVGNWNQNSITNNHVNPYIIGNYNTNLDQGNQNSIANKHVNYVGNWNKNSITNNQVNSSIGGNYNTKANNWSQNSVADKWSQISIADNWSQISITNNHVINSSISGNNYNAHITNSNQNSSANNNTPISSESINNDKNDKNIGSDTNDQKNLEVPIDFSVEATKGNDIVLSTEGNKGQVGSWEAWDGFALAENLNSEDIDICF